MKFNCTISIKHFSRQLNTLQLLQYGFSFLQSLPGVVFLLLTWRLFLRAGDGNFLISLAHFLVSHTEPEYN